MNDHLLQNVNVTPRFTVDLISLEYPVVYRPFNISEQKSIKISSELGDNSSLNQTVLKLLSDCTFNEININSLPSFDIETLFLKIRSASVGDTISFGLKCDNCDTVNNIEISIENDINTIQNENHTDEVFINDDIKLKFAYPDMNMLSAISTDTDEIDQSIEMIARCLIKVYDVKQENVYDELGLEEKKNFIMSLSGPQITKIRSQFFDTMPSNKANIEFECSNCGAYNSTVIEDTESFFQ